MEEKLVFPEMKKKKIKKHNDSRKLVRSNIPQNSKINEKIMKYLNRQNEDEWIDKEIGKDSKEVVYEEEFDKIKYLIRKTENSVVKTALNTTSNPVMIEVIVNDRYGSKERIKCYPSDTIEVLKKLAAAKTGTRAEWIRLQKASKILKDQLTLDDYEIKHGMSIEMYYN